ncbi:MAG TPA: hybrid sensor histidine kinase/response regulator [Bacteroidales bacterium]|nr:hybrid sensor histidine kinase/response regulator [Bacteroidales bacterium]HRZ48952.1 hybrid sensor histidine kinase/response regulator [Bacteroidales bacterium]
MIAEKASILVVDNDINNLSIVEHILCPHNTIWKAMELQEARLILNESTIDLILLDINIPDRKAIQFVEELRNSERFSDIPVIFLSGLNGIDAIVQDFNAGAVDYITKPFLKEELITRVNIHLEYRKMKATLLQKEETIRRHNLFKERLYKVVAHDLRTPFSNISMLISLLDGGYLKPGTEDYKELISSLKESTKGAYFLIDNLLHFTIAQSGTIRFQPTQIMASSLLDEAIQLISNQAKHKDIAIKVDYDRNCSFFADLQMMRSIIRNLLSNAVKFTPNFGTIYISLKSEDKGCLLVVKDNGIGIEKERLEHLFDVVIARTTLGTGVERVSGLGLQLVYDFVNRHKGTLCIDSIPDKGTTFSIRIPSDKQMFG